MVDVLIEGSCYNFCNKHPRVFNFKANIHAILAIKVMHYLSKFYRKNNRFLEIFVMINLLWFSFVLKIDTNKTCAEYAHYIVTKQKVTLVYHLPLPPIARKSHLGKHTGRFPNHLPGGDMLYWSTSSHVTSSYYFEILGCILKL